MAGLTVAASLRPLDVDCLDVTRAPVSVESAVVGCALHVLGAYSEVEVSRASRGKAVSPAAAPAGARRDKEMRRDIERGRRG